MGYLLHKRRPPFRRDEEGGLTILGLYITAAILVIGGIAVDVSHLVAERTRLQMTADLAAHAALYNRDSGTVEEARAAALAVIEDTMPSDRYGTVITAEDILFGSFNPEDQTFTVDDDSRDAVLVNATRNPAGQNAVASFLMQFAGLSEWSIGNQSVFVTYRPACLTEGFVAEGVVDLQSNNGFSNGFCIHSNSHVSLNSNNTFEAGTVVSMPDLDQLDMPRSGFSSNEGLEAALREGRTHIRVLSQLDDIYQGLLTYGSDFSPSYILDAAIYQLSGRRFTELDFVQGRIYYFDCSKTLTLNSSGGVYRSIVIVAECPVKFGSGVVLEDVRILTTSTDADSFSASSGLQIGRMDNCATGGGAQLITYGGMRFPSSLEVYGGQLIAKGDINFAANANGIQGVSMVAGGRIDGTSNMEMGFCGSGMDDNFEADYFRLAT